MAAANDYNIPIEFLRECLKYNPKTGVLTWLQRPREHFSHQGFHRHWNSRFAGKMAGCMDSSGYRLIRVWFNDQQRQLRGHRIAFALMTGRWPNVEIDHRNGVRSDNRWTNLRESTRQQNCHNLPLYSSNTSGYPGIWYHSGKRRRHWQAFISVNGRRRYLGYHFTAEEAYAAYLEAKARLHPFQPKPR